MKALAIVALIFAGLSIFIPVAGVYLAMLCSVMALIAFRSQTTLAGVAFGVNIINTAFLSPMIVLTDMHASGELDINNSALSATKESGDVYWAFVGVQLFLFALAIAWRIIRGTTTQENEKA